MKTICFICFMSWAASWPIGTIYCPELISLPTADNLDEPVLVLEGPVTQLAFSTDGSSILIASQDTIYLKSWPQLETIAVKRFDTGQVIGAAVNADESKLYAACSKPGETGDVVSISWPSGREQQTWQVHADSISALAFSADGLTFATASYDHTIAIIDLPSGQLKTLIGHSRPVRHLIWLDSHYLLSAGEDHSLRVWDIATGSVQQVLEQHTAAIVGLLPLPAAGTDGEKMIVSFGQDRTVRLWQPLRGRMVRFVRLPSQPLCATWSGTGSTILVGDNEGTVHTVDLLTAQIVNQRRLCTDWIESLVRCSESGRILAGTNQGEIYMFQLEQ